ncbi:MAG: hypothetical protein NVSMB62_10580 [Acidobacteriaceae bacterium]
MEPFPVPVIATGLGSFSGGTAAPGPVVMPGIATPLQAAVCPYAAAPHSSSPALNKL